MNKARLIISGTVIAGVSAIAAPASAQALAPQPRAAYSCAEGDICVYSESNGKGTRCAWSGDDSNWGTGVTCNFSTVKSAFNNGRYEDYRHVKFYSKAGYAGKNRVLGWHFKGNLPSGSLRTFHSHKWCSIEAHDGYCR
ncbi:hypothetical protein E1293_29410 [Actinomadura darangshiensis]|uniref:Peptidase inhibitor family I36 protein n=1 Tax=Actinomadura darangshiensis TaxID=705336 RepID=A0A4V2YTP3_9ACTN|nr:peptidase inhibitor family I36 protein [Actinomadura darangshiensis]TDD74527.1 hypothetical protein E1293_29410 [Actinomadura darangshiensis]